MTARLCPGPYRGSTLRFFGRWRIGAMADRRHHGEGEHHQGHMTVPAMPGPALVVIEPELVFRGFKAVLDRPAVTFDRDQRFERCSRWTPSGKEGEIAIGDMATRVHRLSFVVGRFGLKIGQFEITPIVQPRSLGSAPADSRFQSDGGRVRAMSAAVPVTGGRLPQDRKT